VYEKELRAADPVRPSGNSLVDPDSGDGSEVWAIVVEVVVGTVCSATGDGSDPQAARTSDATVKVTSWGRCRTGLFDILTSGNGSPAPNASEHAKGKEESGLMLGFLWWR